jgi:hypothetical protein
VLKFPADLSAWTMLLPDLTDLRAVAAEADVVVDVVAFHVVAVVVGTVDAVVAEDLGIVEEAVLEVAVVAGKNQLRLLYRIHANSNIQHQPWGLWRFPRQEANLLRE